jgi:hypothetical protein
LRLAFADDPRAADDRDEHVPDQPVYRPGIWADPSDRYWSSTTVTENSNLAWQVFFGIGKANAIFRIKHSDAAVRAVRTGS